MPDSHPSSPLHRREFLQQAGAAATAAGVAAGAATPTAARAQDAPAAAPRATLPSRPLGRTGVDVTILNQGTWRAPGALDRILRFAYSNGVRYFDTAKSYGSEGGFKRWFGQMPEVRKEIFLATKDHPNTPKGLLAQLDQRLEALGTDYIDLLFIHALGDHDYGTESAWPDSAEFKETVAALKKSGKVKFVGFSSHHARRAELLQAAAKGGFVDVIMLQYTPWLDTDAPLNKAIDACHKAGIGLVSMKQVAGQFTETSGVLADVVKRVPMLKEKGLTPYQGLLHAIWTDERISSACVSMRTLDQIRENSDAARRYEPVKAAELRQLRDAALAAGPTMCADCDGRCARAAGTTAALGDLARFYTYHEHHGYRGDARALYAALPDAQKDWKGADLAAARAACPNGLDFAKLLPEADRLLS
jgi:aryl-alcohol dehydrogenase-like predicted oxidoreductase